MTHPLRELSLAQLQQRTSVKWRAYPPQVLPAFVAEMDAHPIPAVVQAVTSAMAGGDTGYPAGHEYADAFAQFADERWSWRPDPAAIAAVIDVITGMALVVQTVTRPADRVVLSSPVYGPFFAVIAGTGRTLVDAPLTAEGRLDPARLEEAFRGATDGGHAAAYLLCNPHNPTSVVHTREELSALAALAGRYGVRVICDEIHAPLVETGFTPYLSIEGTDDAFTVTSASKAFNLAGLKAAVVLAGAAARRDQAALTRTIGALPSHLGVIAHVAALRHGGDWLAGVRSDLAANRQLLRDLLTEQLPRVHWNGQPGTYLAWLDCRALGLGDDPAARFLERGRVALSKGTDFGPTGAGFARLNIATIPQLLTEAVHRMAAAVAD